MTRSVGSLSPDERLEKLVSQINKDGRVRIGELSREFDVSEMTIRRDLDELEARGVARRVRGGAVAVGPETFAARDRLNAKAKGRIAEKLQALIPDTGTVAFDASSTVHRLASLLEGARDLHVLTNGLDTFQSLADRPGITVSLTGGMREPRTGSLVGPLAERSGEDLLFEVLICSAAALDPDLGSSEASLAEAEVKRALAQSASRVILAVDSSKLGTRSSGRVFRPEEVDLLVTELDPEDAEMSPYRGHFEIR